MSAAGRTYQRRSTVHVLDRFNDGVADVTHRTGVFIVGFAQAAATLAVVLVILGMAFALHAPVLALIALTVGTILFWFGFRKVIRALAGEKLMLADDTHGVARLATEHEMELAGMLRATR
jgi:uncharacterized membrane protein